MQQYGSEKVLPYDKKEGKGEQIRHMFDSISHTYDFLNHALSLGIDYRWRKKGVAFLKPFAPDSILDLATGTGDLAIYMHRILHPTHITGADISEGMMNVGREKVEKMGLTEHISFEWQDALSMTYPDNSFDAVTAAYGVRNFEDIEKGLSEMLRVLKPGGHLMILELSQPEHFPMKQLYRIYSRVVIPTVGRLFSKEKNAYSYLPASIRVMPQGDAMKELLRKVEFDEVEAKTFTFGICSLYTGRKRQ